MGLNDFFPVLEDDRAMLRPLQMDDLHSLLPVALQDSLWKVGIQCISNEEDLSDYIRQAIRERGNRQSIPFLIFDKRNNCAAGSTRFGNIVFPHKRLEIGWTWIGEAFQGSGLNKHMKYLMLEHAFEAMEMNRVEIKTDVLNERSRRAILGLGAKQEGIFRSHMVTDTGRIRDTIYFSIIKEEWPEVKERLRKKIRNERMKE